jgi:tetratricopeptide (TPR) repeat protein
MGETQPRDPLFERLRTALAPGISVEGKLGGGGMGLVYLGRDVTLDRLVAIKTIRPEHSTAAARERFLREMRVLAKVSHPNVVTVYQAGEVDGIPYFVMDYVEAETLEVRLARGPLPAPEALRLASDLLRALDAAHRRGLVHRDVKPSNIFLAETGALLGDFGIAKSTGQTRLTATDVAIGTPGYMAPEQMAGTDVTPAVDIYAAGLVVYESLTGRKWHEADATAPDWSGVPHGVRRVLERAVAFRPEERFRSADDFRRALERAAGRRRKWLVPSSIAAVMVIVAVWWAARPAEPPAALLIRVMPFVVHGAPDRPWIGDSLARELVRRLGAPQDFAVRGPGRGQGRGRERAAHITLFGEASASGDRLVVTVRARFRGRGEAPGFASAEGRFGEWPQLADSLARKTLIAVWNVNQNPLATELPIRALPKTERGASMWITAERLYNSARWGEAYRSYLAAVASDSTCLLCEMRLSDVERWLLLPHDPARPRRIHAAIDSFPPSYRSIIRAGLLPAQHRLDTLSAVAARAGGFALAWFLLGDELFHRGPLMGGRRADAIVPLRRAAAVQPDFAPAWEHLAWTLTAEGDSAEARGALERYLATSQASEPATMGLRALVEAGFAWRFLAPEMAAGMVEARLSRPEIEQLPDLGVGPRLLPSFDAPAGAVWFGERLTRVSGRPDVRASGIIAQMFGHLALGRPTRALELARELNEEFPSSGHALLAAELEGAVALLADSAPASAALGDLEARLLELTGPGAAEAALRLRAAWMLALLAGAAGRQGDLTRYLAALEGEAPPRPLLTIARWHERARGRGRGRDPGSFAAAVAGTEGLLALDSAGRYGDPFARSVLHLLRAGWLEAQGLVERARRELRWHENVDTSPGLGGDAQPAEIAIGRSAPSPAGAGRGCWRLPATGASRPATPTPRWRDYGPRGSRPFAPSPTARGPRSRDSPADRGSLDCGSR